MVPSVAGRFGLQYRVLEVRTVDGLEAAFATATRDDLQALYISWTLFSVFMVRASSAWWRAYGSRRYMASAASCTRAA